MKTSKKWYVIFGLGKTGISCARYFQRNHIPFFFIDHCQLPPNSHDIYQEFSNVAMYLGIKNLSEILPKNIEKCVVSPGIPYHTPLIQEMLHQGISVISDLDLFFQEITQPVIGVTGTNGKSTVVTLLDQMAKQAGISSQMAGNIGIPVLDCLKNTACDLYILELSSFQLERCQSLKLKVALFLNIAEDHLDAHLTFENYLKAKRKIFHCCEAAVFNHDDKNTWPSDFQKKKYSFTSQKPTVDQWGIVRKKEGHWLAQGEKQCLLAKEMLMIGEHNVMNALAALTVGTVLQWPLSTMLDVLRCFSGLPYRCQWIAHRCHANWYNDSKGTNEAATIAAIESLIRIEDRKLILIGGGAGKETDFCHLATCLQRCARHVILYGRDANKIERAIAKKIPVSRVKNLQEAVCVAAKIVQKGERVLFSPACTSWDMFTDYNERGRIFTRCVYEL